MRRLFLALALPLLLGSCAAIQGYSDEALKKGKEAKDTEAVLLINGQCAAGRGATNRLFADQPNKLAAHDLLCDGPNDATDPPTLDAETIKTIRLLFDLKSAADAP